MKKGIFITVEGCEGAGKSTQAKLLADHLTNQGYQVLVTREPGGTVIGEKIRGILLDRNHWELTPSVELLLYLASRSQLVSQVIKPALEEGQVVISDRFHHSTLAYQGGARALDMPLVRKINEFATEGILPDMTFLLDLPPEIGLERKGSYDEDRMEGQGIEFHQKVRQAFLSLAGEEPERIVVIDANQAMEKISSSINQHMKALLARHSPGRSR
jgi:dTMP kinase